MFLALGIFTTEGEKIIVIIIIIIIICFQGCLFLFCGGSGNLEKSSVNLKICRGKLGEVKQKFGEKSCVFVGGS